MYLKIQTLAMKDNCRYGEALVHTLLCFQKYVPFKKLNLKQAISIPGQGCKSMCNGAYKGNTLKRRSQHNQITFKKRK